jgi:membrane protein
METENRIRQAFFSFFNKIKVFFVGEFARFRRLISMFFEDGCTIWASTNSMVTLFAIVPLIAISFPIVSSFQIFADTKAKVIEFIIKYIVPAASSLIIEYINKFVENSSGINIYGMFSFIMISMSLMISIEHSFNAVWKVKKSRTITSKLTVYWTAITITPILIGFSFYISNFFPDLRTNSFAQYLYYLWGKIFPVLLVWLAFFVLYKLMPNKEVKSVPAIIGSFFAALFWEIGKRIFSFFIGHFANYEQIYGPASTAILMLLWIYVSWLIILFCGEIAYDIQHQSELKKASLGKAKGERNYREFYALKVIELLIDQFKKGKEALTHYQISKKLKLSPEIVQEILIALKDKNIVEKIGKKKTYYIISKNPELISFGDAIFSLNQDFLLTPEENYSSDKINNTLNKVRKKLEDVLNKSNFAKI